MSSEYVFIYISYIHIYILDTYIHTTSPIEFRNSPMLSLVEAGNWPICFSGTIMPVAKRVCLQSVYLRMAFEY